MFLKAKGFKGNDELTDLIEWNWSWLDEIRTKEMDGNDDEISINIWDLKYPLWVKLFAEVEVCQFESTFFVDRVTKKIAFNCNLIVTLYN